MDKRLFLYLAVKNIIYRVTLSSVLLLSVFFSSCKKDAKTAIPVLSTVAATGIDAVTAVSGGNITSDGGAEITAKGVCWSTSPSPNINNTRVLSGTGLASFSSQLLALSENTTYYVKAYAINSNGVGYGQQISFTTLGHATVTGQLSAIATTSLQVTGSVDKSGGATITSRGFCWDTIPNPTTAINKLETGTGTGAFNNTIPGLIPGKTYYIRAYAVNSIGTAYSTQFIVTTNGIDIDGNIYHTITIGTQVWMVENLKATHFRNGDAMPNITDNTTWETANIAAYCDYNNDAANGAVYGHLYNYIAAHDIRNICPKGWRLPNSTDWQTLSAYLGGDNVTGGKMKEAGTTHWTAPNTNASNSSGFTGLPAGNRGYGGFASIGMACYFWSAAPESFSRSLLNNTEAIAGVGNTNDGPLGFTIRCIQQ